MARVDAIADAGGGGGSGGTSRSSAPVFRNMKTPAAVVETHRNDSIKSSANSGSAVGVGSFLSGLGDRGAHHWQRRLQTNAALKQFQRYHRNGMCAYSHLC